MMKSMQVDITKIRDKKLKNKIILKNEADKNIYLFSEVRSENLNAEI